MIIDVHTHAFPESLAARAMEVLSKPIADSIQPVRDGTLQTLIASMDESGIDCAFLASIATRPEQAPAILSWSQSIDSTRIVPLGSVHPRSQNWEAEIEAVAGAGFPGLKFHAQYQGFVVDADEMFPVYRKAASLGLFVLFHGGFDVAFPGDESSAPKRLARIRHRVDDLRMIVAHVGGWQAWDEAIEFLVGRDVYLDTSHIHSLEPRQLETILSRHSHERILFASDTPWVSQRESLALVRSLPLGARDLRLILGQNAIGLCPALASRVAAAKKPPSRVAAEIVG
jgi:uncharacterized protein